MRLVLTLYAFLTFSPAFSQYYLRGEVRDQQGRPVGGARITLASKGDYPFYVGSSGTFGIPTSKAIDTISFSAEGFEQLKTPVVTSQYGYFTLKMMSKKANSSGVRLSSLTKNFLPSEATVQLALGESYSSTVENQFVPTKEYPETGFALHVDRASYSNVRRFLNNKSKPPADAVRIEELLNYFNFKTKNADDLKEVLTVSNHLTTCPWQPRNQLLFINVQAKKIKLDHVPPTNLVFLIDVSGSMDMHNRLPLLKSGFKLLVENLRAIDTVSIVTYGSDVAIMLTPTSGENKEKIVAAIEGLQPAGSTPGESAIRLAYKLAKNTYIKNGMNRVILATDGDFNVGQTTEKELEELISQQKQSGIYLTCLGVGMGNYKDSKLEALARRGNGNFAYLDNETEAEKVLVEEFAQTVYSVANNVFANIKFDPTKVNRYRLIGFDNKRNSIADSSSQVEGGELGSGHSLLAVFEIEPTQVPDTNHLKEEHIAQLELSYKLPGKKETVQKTVAVKTAAKRFEAADSCLRFASAVIMFGSLIKQSAFAKDMSWEQLKMITSKTVDPTNLLQNEFVQLVDVAEKMLNNRKKKKLDLFKKKVSP